MGLFSRKKKVEFLAKPKKTKTKRPVKFTTKDGESVSSKLDENHKDEFV